VKGGIIPSLIVKKIKEFEGAGLVSIEEAIHPSLMRNTIVEGIGIVVRRTPPSVHNKFYSKRYMKVGSVIRFKNVPVTLLEPYRDYVLFLITRAILSGVELDLDLFKRVFVAEYELVRTPMKIKRRFKAWVFYSGEIKYGKKVWKVNWMVRVPTRINKHIMFLCSRDDAIAVANIVLRYRHLKYSNKIVAKGEYPVAILFS